MQAKQSKAPKTHHHFAEAERSKTAKMQHQAAIDIKVATTPSPCVEQTVKNTKSARQTSKKIFPKARQTTKTQELIVKLTKLLEFD